MDSYDCLLAFARNSTEIFVCFIVILLSRSRFCLECSHFAFCIFCCVCCNCAISFSFFSVYTLHCSDINTIKSTLCCLRNRINCAKCEYFRLFWIYTYKYAHRKNTSFSSFVEHCNSIAAEKKKRVLKQIFWQKYVAIKRNKWICTVCVRVIYY